MRTAQEWLFFSNLSKFKGNKKKVKRNVSEAAASASEILWRKQSSETTRPVVHCT